MRTLRLILVFTALVSFSPSLSHAAAVLLIGSGDASNNAMIESVLAAQGDTVTVGPTYTNFTGGNLSGYSDVLLVPNGTTFPTLDMPTSGQQALVNYVNSGGGLVTSEWLLQGIASEHTFQTLSSVLPFSTGSGDIGTINSPITFRALTNDPVINANLPSSFTFPAGNGSGSYTESYYLPKPGATTFFSTNQWTSTFGGYGPAYGVVGWNYGLGRVISFSTALDNTSLANPNFDQLVGNAVAWARQQSGQLPMGPDPPHGPVSPTPEPATLLAWGVGILGMAAASIVRRRRVSA